MDDSSSVAGDGLEVAVTDIVPLLLHLLKVISAGAHVSQGLERDVQDPLQQTISQLHVDRLFALVVGGGGGEERKGRRGKKLSSTSVGQSEQKLIIQKILNEN